MSYPVEEIDVAFNLQNLVESQPQNAKISTRFKELLQAVDNAIAACSEN